MRAGLEYAAAWVVLRGLGVLPRALARACGAAIVRFVFIFRPGLRRAAMTNLRIAFPDWDDGRRQATIRALVRNIGWMAGEFSQFPKYNRENIEHIVVLDGFENFADAQRRGQGVLFLTGHCGAWELGPFAQSLYGNPLHFLVRAIDNVRVDRLVNHYRCLSGNTPIEKSQSARAILNVMRAGGTVGILMDQNASPNEGIFVDFFGVPACTTTGLARIAMRTGAAVVPAFTPWDASLRKYRLTFQKAVELAHTGDEEADVRENTARFNAAIEDFARRHPEQWLWVHKRWKTRPPGEKNLYL